MKDSTLVLETHLEDSTVLKPPASSASSPNPQPCFRGSCRPRVEGQVTWEPQISFVCVHVSQFSVCLAGGEGLSEQASKHYGLAAPTRIHFWNRLNRVLILNYVENIKS